MILKESITGVSKMAIWGVPGYLLAFALNYGFNEILDWNVYFAYFLVSVIVTTLNFFIIDKFVFKGDKESGHMARVGGYFTIVYSSKIGEWLLYSFLVWAFPIYFLLAQLCVTLTFFIVKYFSLRKVLT